MNRTAIAINRREAIGITACEGFSIGDTVDQKFDFEKMQQGCRAFMAKRGQPIRPTREATKLGIWRKINRGIITGEMAQRIKNDPANAKYFAKFAQEFPEEVQQ